MICLPVFFILVSSTTALELWLDGQTLPSSPSRRTESKNYQYFRDRGYRDYRRQREENIAQGTGTNSTVWCCDASSNDVGLFGGVNSHAPGSLNKALFPEYKIHDTQIIFTMFQKPMRRIGLDSTFSDRVDNTRRVTTNIRVKRNSTDPEDTTSNTSLGGSRISLAEKSFAQTMKLNNYFIELSRNQSMFEQKVIDTSIATKTRSNTRKTTSNIPVIKNSSKSGRQTISNRTNSSHAYFNLTSTSLNPRMLKSSGQFYLNQTNTQPSHHSLVSFRQSFVNITRAHLPPRSLASAPKPVPRLEDGPISRRDHGRGRLIYRSPSLKSLNAARELLLKEPLVDGHNDLPWNVRVLLNNQLQKLNLSSDLRMLPAFRDSGFSHTDLPRLRAGLVGAQVWSIHIPCGAQFLNAVQLLVEQIDVVRRMIHSCEQTTLVKTPEGLQSVWSQGLLASMISVGGGHGLGSSVGVLRSLHDLGVTSLSLTHSCHTPWAQGDDDAEGQFTERGLTNFGKAIVREMNRLGMMVDIAHTSAVTARDAIATSLAPVIISHTAARAICNLPRNVPDSILHALRTNKGLAMVTFDSDFLACGRNATIRSVIDHLEHIRRIAGVDHVGLGSAFDGFDKPAHGLKDTSQYPALFAALMEARPAWSEEDLLKLSGRNFIRVFHRVKQVQKSMSKQLPSEDIIPYRDIDTRWPCRYKFTKADHPYS